MTKTATISELSIKSRNEAITNRTRRLRATAPLRDLVCESHLRPEKLIYPYFIVEGTNIKNPIESMPGIFQLSIDNFIKDLETTVEAGIGAVLLFGIPNHKDAEGSEAWKAEGIVQKAIRAAKKNFPELVVIADTCLCEYTDHGHCGLVGADGVVENDSSVELLARAAVSQAEAGADIIAPSDMMDGRIGVIRAALDQAGFQNTPILAYSAKFASALYGPFRQAAGSTPQFGDRKAYQMDPANGREALREIELDIEEGADMVMIKPALSYLDLVSKARSITNLPIAAYNVSGEYSMVKAAAANGWIDERRVVLETLTGIVRAGADLIITYHARDIANWLRH